MFGKLYLKVTVLMTVLVLLLSVVSISKAEVTGTCTLSGISFIDMNKRVEAIYGTATLKNEREGIIAEGDLGVAAGFAAIKGKPGATFTHTPNVNALPEETWAKETVKDFPVVEWGPGNHWRLKDGNFYFFIEMPVVTMGIYILTDQSLTRASVISLPEGNFSLWGYTVVIKKGGGKLKFLHGKVVDGSNANVTGPDQSTLKYGKKKIGGVNKEV